MLYSITYSTLLESNTEAGGLNTHNFACLRLFIIVFCTVLHVLNKYIYAESYIGKRKLYTSGV